ncbi:MAG: hypothetical protein J6T17_05650 [Clostridia bacterium]|nr:hypothetical protein [Clostridia bacterium]
MYQETVTPLPELGADAGVLQVMERYADIMYFAALNAWELDGHGTVEDFPHTRGDFHGWMQADRKGFAEGVKFAVSALTGKTARQLLAEEEKRRESEKEAAKNEQAEPVKKKRSWIYRITHPSRPSS